MSEPNSTLKNASESEPPRHSNGRCFVIMPLSTRKQWAENYRHSGDGEHFTHVYNWLFKPAIEKANFEPIFSAADGSELIHDKIVHNLEQCEMALCDLSTLNANVMFELGIRTAVNKPVAIVTDSTIRNDDVRVPFDMSIIHYEEYKLSLHPWDLANEVLKLSRHIEKCFEHSKNENVLWKRFKFSTVADIEKDAKNITKDQKFDWLINEMLEIRREMSKKSASNFVDNLEDLSRRRSANEVFDRILSDFDRKTYFNYSRTHIIIEDWKSLVDNKRRGLLQRIQDDFGCEIKAITEREDGSSIIKIKW